MKNFIIRSISGAVFVGLMLLAIDVKWLFYPFFGFLFLLCLGEFINLLRKRSSNVLYYLLGLVYLLVGFLSTVGMGHWFAVIFLTIVWSNDVGAYLVGISIGRHKMAPKISPKKSWEGFFGGLIFAVATTLLWAFNKHELVIDEIPWYVWSMLGLVTAIGAVVGDLIESWFKRWIGVKDSGILIPGHGGVLDRLDAMIFAAPLFLLFILFVLPLYL